MFLKNLLKQIKLNESTISMILGSLVVIVVGALVVNYFRNVSTIEKAPEEITPTVETEIQPDQSLPAVYTVKKGDSLWKISESFWGSGYNWVDIVKENNLSNPDVLYVGRELRIPKTEVIKPTLAQKEIPTGVAISTENYTVVKGDYLWKIAVRAYGDGYQWVKIARENHLTNPNLIHPGNNLKLPR